MKTPPETTHGGARSGAGRPEAPYVRKNVTIELPEPCLKAWDAYNKKNGLSRPESIAKMVHWKKPRRKAKKP